MRREIEPPRALLEAEALDDRVDDPALCVDRKRTAEHGVVHRLGAVGDRPDQRQERLLEALEHCPRLDGSRALLVVVEEDVVGRTVRLEAIDVAQLELHVAAEIREERREVRCRPRLDPRLLADRRGTHDLGAQLGRDLPGFLPVTPRDPDQARVVGVAGQALLVRPELLQQLPDLVGRELLVGDSPQRRELLRSRCRAASGHHRLLVPAENTRGLPEVGNLGQTLSQLLKLPLHDTRRRRNRRMRPGCGILELE
jgi:hypothetical protein